jgi:plasmid segregation protein ParM
MQTSAVPAAQNPVVRAIDVGYGNTKYVTHRSSSAVQCDLFPSLALRAVEDVTGGLLGGGRVVNVMVEGVRYAVGPDASKSRVARQDGRILTDDYCLTAEYRALVYGALAQMHERDLAVLVLGLPLSTYAAYRERLEKAFTGSHLVDGKDLLVTVRRCLVVPQPLGGFYDYSLAAGRFAAMRSETSLIVDPGYCTLDWLVAEGTVPVSGRSGAVSHGGMAEVLRGVLAQVAKDASCTIDELGNADRIDQALRNRTPIRVFGKELPRDIGEYIKIAQAAAADPMRKLLAGVGQVGDIDNVLLVGGGAQIYRDLLAQHFPRHEIQVVQDGVHSNVRGFQALGELMLRKAQAQ